MTGRLRAHPLVTIEARVVESIPEATVCSDIKKLMDKLGARDRTHAVTIAVRLGLLEI